MNEEVSNMVNEKVSACYIGMSVAYLRKCRCEGKIGNRTLGPPYYKLSAAIRYRISDLDAWLEKHKVGNDVFK